MGAVVSGLRLPGLDTPGSAILSADERYRYRLTRAVTVTNRPVVWVMLNPSTADATTDDPTIRRVLGFSQAWACGPIHVVNLYAYRATNPDDLLAADDPVGPDNDEHVHVVLGIAEVVVAAWGAKIAQAPRGHERASAVLGTAEALGKPVYCLGTTIDGYPRHPLYVPGASTPRMLQ